MYFEENEYFVSEKDECAEITADDDGRHDQMSIIQLAGILPTVTTQLQPIPASDRAAEILRRTSHFFVRAHGQGHPPSSARQSVGSSASQASVQTAIFSSGLIP